MKIEKAKKILMDLIGNDTLYDMEASPAPGLEMHLVNPGTCGWRRAAVISKDEAIEAYFDWCEMGWRGETPLTKAELKSDWRQYLKNNRRIMNWNQIEMSRWRSEV